MRVKSALDLKIHIIFQHLLFYGMVKKYLHIIPVIFRLCVNLSHAMDRWSCSHPSMVRPLDGAVRAMCTCCKTLIRKNLQHSYSAILLLVPTVAIFLFKEFSFQLNKDKSLSRELENLKFKSKSILHIDQNKGFVIKAVFGSCSTKIFHVLP